jgi:hypothetical protein
VFETASIWNRAPVGAADPKIIAVLLLIRTLSNSGGTVILLRADRIVEARTIARCCFENLFHIAALREDGQQFVREMAEDHEASRKARGEFFCSRPRDKGRGMATEIAGVPRQPRKRPNKAKVVGPEAGCWPRATA